MTNKKTVAEGVENQQILECLATLGVAYAQACHLGRPVPLDELLALQPVSQSR